LHDFCFFFVLGIKSQELDASDESTTENELTDTEEAGSTNQSEYEDINPLPVGSSSSHLMHENSETSNKRRKGLSDSVTVTIIFLCPSLLFVTFFS
jgi:hypothetical protein